MGYIEPSFRTSVPEMKPYSPTQTRTVKLGIRSYDFSSLSMLVRMSL